MVESGIDISVVLGTYQRKRFLKIAINSIRKEFEEQNLKNEIIVIDGGSTDGTINWLTRQKDIISIVQYNNGNWKGQKIAKKSWGYFMNLGFKCSQGKYICMLSDDCLIIPGAIKNGFTLIESKLKSGINIGALAFYFRDWPINKDYFVQSEFNKLYVNHGLYLREAIQKVNYVDEEYMFYNADIDLCLKLLKEGYLTEASASSYIEHFSFANPMIRMLNNQTRINDNDRLLKKWIGIYYNNIEEIKGIERHHFKEYDDEAKTFKKFKNVLIMKDIYMAKLFSAYMKIRRLKLNI